MKKNFPKQIVVLPPKSIKYGLIFPFLKPCFLKFQASVKFFEPPWEGKNISARISKINEKDLKMLREIKDAILSHKIIGRYSDSIRLLQNGIIFAKFEKGKKIWIDDDLADPPQNQEIRGEVLIRFQHVFIGANSNPHRSISCVLESFSC